MNYIIDARALREEVDMVEFLRKLGHQPVGKSGGRLSYHSPVRHGDRTPSFFLNPQTGYWSDYGLPGKGDVITFAKLYWPAMTFFQQLQKIKEVCDLPLHKLQFAEGRVPKERPRLSEKVPSFEVVAVKSLGNNPILEEFLRGRSVWEAAQGKLFEVYYRMKANESRPAQHLFGVGWLNEFREWEVRTAKNFKSFLGTQKGLSIFPGSQSHLVLFEGIMDYLSWATDHKDQQPTAMVLNGAGLIDLAVKAAAGYEHQTMFFDSDAAGREATKTFLKVYPSAVDGAVVYAGYKDYNAMHMAKAKAALPWQSPDFFDKGSQGHKR